MIELEKLGKRIAIIGCSSSGKSSLAHSLSKKLNIPAYHLDFFAHQENTNWKRRSDEELVVAHAKLLDQPEWIIEGNYSICMPERFQQATSIIWLDENVWMATLRYVRRSLFSVKSRIGKLPGSKKEFQWQLLKHILLTYPKNRSKYQKLLTTFHGAFLVIPNMSLLQDYYRYWGLVHYS